MCHCCTFCPMMIIMPMRIIYFFCLVIIFLCCLRLHLPSTAQKYMSLIFSKYSFFSDLVPRTLFIFSFFLICSFLRYTVLFCFSFREVDGQWVEEEKLEAHSDWVRDVAWAPNVGLPVSTIASCSQVK